MLTSSSLSLSSLSLLAATAALVLALAGPAAAENVCGDVNASGTVTSGDALLVLRKAVGQDVDGMLCGLENQFGDPDDYNDTVYVPQNYLLGQEFQVDRVSIVTHIGVITRVGGPKGRFTIYSDDNGSPGEYVAGTFYVDLKLGAQKIPVTMQKGLQPGNYWLVARFNTTTEVAGNPDAGDSAVIKYKFQDADGAPGTFGEAEQYTGQRLNYWVEVEN
ncbi:MAG: hypothetical protein ABR538_16675 [Candidatus Binatia bacterium]